MAEKLKWETKKVKVKDLIELDINPRKISEAKKQKLIESLEKFNLAEIPAVNTDMQIIGGNQRVSALMMVGRGEEEIDVRVPNRKLTKKEVKEYAIISNTHAGEFDFEILEEWFVEDVNIEEIGFEIPGWDDWQTQMDKELVGEVQDDDFDVPVGGSETDIVEGDIFEIGHHRLLCGSSTQTDNWGRIMGQELADLVITDPPYNVAYTGGTKDALTIKNDSMADGDFYQFLYDFYTALGSYTKAGGAWYVWHADSEGANFRKAMADAGIAVKQCLIWVKNTMVMGRQDYHWKHEPCLYGWKEGAAHGWYNDRKQTTVLNFERPQRNAEHPTMKPIPLIAYQMGNSSKAGDVVADGFGGSGTTMVAAHQTNRRCRMMELDPRYCQVIIDRMRKLEPGITILKNGKKI
ncbi:MAG: DNA modification methylase [Acetoanaerobium sp.]|nr:DNA modification methylase [Acetoanaerobium sp.]